MANRERRLRAGEWVVVREKEEILETLDSKAELDGMPFMPEMFSFCGKRFQVYKRAHKTCDTVFPTRGRRVDRAVHLATRCTGDAHGGCQAGCLIFWKEAWLRRDTAPSGDARAVTSASQYESVTKQSAVPLAEPDVWANIRIDGTASVKPVYKCQATRLPYATSDLAWWDVRQYVEDYTSGNVSLGRMIAGLIYSVYYNLSQAGIGLGRPMRWLYNRLSPLWGGPQFPRLSGTIPEGQPTPTATLNLQPGELVRVKPHQDILRTITSANKNRGMSWDAEMVPFCNQTHRVAKRVIRIIDENTGEMKDMKSPCIILESVVCQARYSGCRMFCPRSIFPYWREIWLERVGSACDEASEVKDSRTFEKSGAEASSPPPEASTVKS